MHFTVLIFFIIAAIVVGLVEGLRKHKLIKKSVSRNEQLLIDGRKIEIFFNECEIKSTEYDDPIDKESLPSKIEIFDSLRINKGDTNVGNTHSQSLDIIGMSLR